MSIEAAPAARTRTAALLRSPVALDIVIALAVLAETLAALATDVFAENGEPGLGALAGVLAALTSLPLAARRFAPLSVFALTVGATAALYGLGYALGPPIGFAIALYTVADRRDLTSPAARRAVLGAGAAGLLAVHATGNDFFDVHLLFAVLIWSVAWFAGDRARLRRQRIAELEERALRAEREAEQERRLAAAEERTRIARELHDSAGHAVNVILVQAGAARLLYERDRTRSLEALGTIEEVARETIGEIDRLVRLLREDRDGAEPLDEVEPPAGLAALDTLAERHRAAGLDLTIEVRGEPRQLSSRVDRTAYRVLQEAITNAARHGRGAAEVDVEFGERALEVVVTNPRRPGAPRRAAGGHGIVGMRERVALVGGTLDARAVDGDFRVRARLPYTPEAR